MHVKDPWLSDVRLGHCVPLAGFCLSLYGLYVLNMDVNMIQTNKQTNKKAFFPVCSYRLAVGHKYPVPLDDCLTAYLHFARNSEKYGVDPSRIAVAGKQLNVYVCSPFKLSQPAFEIVSM